jgi:hypothetical protein
MVAKLVRPACRALFIDNLLVGLCWPVMINFPAGARPNSLKTPAGALETAVDLRDLGFEEVSIIDSKGGRHSPADFARLYTDKNGTDTQSPEKREAS